MADQTAAAIRRASQAARNGMEQLDARTVAELTRIYTEAADQVRAAILSANGSRVSLDQLRGLQGRIEQVLTALASANAALIDQALMEAAELGVRPFTGPGLAATGRAVEPVLGTLRALDVVDKAVAFTQQFREADGLVLSDRLWRVDRGARDAVMGAVEQAVVRGWSADKAAAQFVMDGQAVPVATQQAQAGAAVAEVLRAADYLDNADSGGLAATLRVMRTEINRAHGEAYMAGGAEAPGVVGFRFLLSPRHPRVDVCDLFARQNLFGLGPGVYPDRKSCPWPAHPNTLSFVVAVFAPEVSAVDAAAKETTLQALERLGPDIRAGVLGPTKATYFDQGVLTKGMVRARVGAVRMRLVRKAQ